MLKKTLLTTSAGLLLSLGAPQVHALSLTLDGYEGTVQIKFSIYTAECTTPVGGGGSCYGGDVANPNQGGGPGGNTYNETTWGLGTITTIQDNSGNPIWQAPLLNSNDPNAKDILFLVYGIADARASDPSGTDPNIYNVGCQGGPCDGHIHFDAYEVDHSAYKAQGGLAGYSTGARTGFSSFTGVTNPANLVFQMDFAAGIDQSGHVINGFDAALAEMVQTVSATTLPTSGRGAWLGDCVSGPACSGVNQINFDTNGQPQGTDFFGQFTLQAVTNSTALNNGWLGFSNDPINTASVPEPNVMFLFVGGLFGLTTVRRSAKSRS